MTQQQVDKRVLFLQYFISIAMVVLCAFTGFAIDHMIGIEREQAKINYDILENKLVQERDIKLSIVRDNVIRSEVKNIAKHQRALEQFYPLKNISLADIEEEEIILPE